MDEILQITVYYKELLTINCQGTNHPRSILSFMVYFLVLTVSLTITFPPISRPSTLLVTEGRPYVASSAEEGSGRGKDDPQGACKGGTSVMGLCVPWW